MMANFKADGALDYTEQSSCAFRRLANKNTGIFSF